MKNFIRFVTPCALLLLLIASCKKETNYENKETRLLVKDAASTAALKAKLAALRSSLPAGYEKRLEQNTRLVLKTHPEYRYAVRKALGAVEPTECSDATLVNQWLGEQLSDWDADVIFYALLTGILDFPTYDALLFENSSASQRFGLDGDQTHQVTKVFKDLKRFWDIQSDNIVIVGMHGSMLLNRDKIIRIDRVLYGDNEQTAAFWADLIIELMNEVPQYRRGDHPIFTFNAFAQPSFFFEPVGIISPKIIVGDGILEAYDAIGFGDIAPQAIVAHEFGHHIQFQLGLFGDQSGPEATRRTELMADAYAAYYLSHARGASMQWKRVQQFLQVFFNIGDCSFTSDGHHGTPTQRMAAAMFGYKVADDAQKQGHILSSRQFTALFEAALPQILSH